MPRPTPTTQLQEDLYESLGPLAWDDANQGWALLLFCGALAATLDTVDGYARDDGDYPGWSELLDADRCPTEALPYLAQFAGVQLRAGLSEADQRTRIKSADGMKRGTITSMIAAAQAYLTGTKTVLYRERDGGAYNLTILTYTAETPDSAKVLAALLEQKPAGILLTYSTVTGATYLLIRASYATYTAVRSAFLTYNGLRNNVPGT